jgi:hypothetical protein
LLLFSCYFCATLQYIWPPLELDIPITDQLIIISILLFQAAGFTKF